jgi:hypothetical protein
MRLLAILAVLGAVGVGAAISANGVQVWAPAGWHRIAPAGDGPVTDPRTLLVVGTSGVRPHFTQCQIAAYRIPPDGAVVVIVGWKGANGDPGVGTKELARLTAVKRSVFECFKGRGAAATVVLRQREYQVNVMVGDRATKRRIGEALDVARSFALKG